MNNRGYEQQQPTHYEKAPPGVTKQGTQTDSGSHKQKQDGQGTNSDHDRPCRGFVDLGLNSVFHLNLRELHTEFNPRLHVVHETARLLADPLELGVTRSAGLPRIACTGILQVGSRLSRFVWYYFSQGFRQSLRDNTD